MYHFTQVLILIVVEDGLVRDIRHTAMSARQSLNPYCSGRWSRTMHEQGNNSNAIGLNPYCSGRWSRTAMNNFTISGFVVS